MINNEDIEFIKESFKYVLDRMKDLPNEIWGKYEDKQKKVFETEKRQREIIQKQMPILLRTINRSTELPLRLTKTTTTKCPLDVCS